MTGINRRRFSQVLAGGLFATSLPLQAGTAERPGMLFASACKSRDGRHLLLLVDEEGNEVLQHPLPGRAHHVACHPQQPLLAAVARRPERFIDLVDFRDKHLLQRIDAGEGRHFYGHAIFSGDGRYLISSENRLSDGSGRITLRDSQQGYAIVADHPSYGIGPHEIALLAGGSQLAIANGGILTHPDKGRDKLNLDSMQPSLAIIDLHSGELLEQQFMPPSLHQLSIRHLDVNARNEVIIALQYQGDAWDDVPLVALHRPGQPLQLLRAPAGVNRQMKQYCGSARFDRSGRYAAVSSPRGDLITFWDSRDGRYISQSRVRDGCALSATGRAGEFLVTSGRGKAYHYDLLRGDKQLQPLQLQQPVSWDNHMTLV
ncbi:DUF1513 domain-containing protein [Marinobacterium jannaschii]|uniref:DUF1513 domain-containing protein n=1 Tax=Marinobacterium jannaschii TaxID=64970 RepID=UPI0005683914|nr:DUF1513 domain-containing protein [Marinobacterium jannaschii]